MPIILRGVCSAQLQQNPMAMKGQVWIGLLPASGGIGLFAVDGSVLLNTDGSHGGLVYYPKNPLGCPRKLVY